MDENKINANKYYEQAVQCVSGYVLPEQRKLFEACHGDLDLFYQNDPNNEMYFTETIKSGSEYVLGYKRCTCSKVASGECTNPELCECSKQSILFILKELMPEREIKVEIMESVLRGSKTCRFHIFFDPSGITISD